MVIIIKNKKLIFFIFLAFAISTIIYFAFLKKPKNYNGVFVSKFLTFEGDKNGNLY